MHGVTVEPISEADLAETGMLHCGAYHAADSFIAPAGDIELGIFMGVKQRAHLLPVAARIPRPREFSDFLVAFEKFQLHLIGRGYGNGTEFPNNSSRCASTSRWLRRSRGEPD